MSGHAHDGKVSLEELMRVVDRLDTVKGEVYATAHAMFEAIGQWIPGAGPSGPAASLGPPALASPSRHGPNAPQQPDDDPADRGERGEGARAQDGEDRDRGAIHHRQHDEDELCGLRTHRANDDESHGQRRAMPGNFTRS